MFHSDKAGRRLILLLLIACYACVFAAKSTHSIMTGKVRLTGFRAARAALSTPFADTDWGRMLLTNGEPDDTIAKFQSAHAEGPHFADPLEMWGEALMQENRSYLALAKFEEANKYAPNRGRLHLEWGRALYYTGEREEAKKQFGAAAHLILFPSDAAMLARIRTSHV
jgi:tetratricopeptide (TPR) repeat protein